VAYELNVSLNTVDALKDAIVTFAVAQGWTLQVDEWPNFLQLSNDACHINLRRNIITVDDDNGVERIDTELQYHLSTGYNGVPATGTLKWWQQPDSLVAASSSERYIRTNDLTGPFQSVHFFAPDTGPKYIYVVIETLKNGNRGYFTHLFFGNLDKLGQSYSPGGAFATGTRYLWYGRSPYIDHFVNWDEEQHFMPFSYWNANSRRTQHVRVDGALTGAKIRDDTILPLYFRANDQDSGPFTVGARSGGMSTLFPLGPNPLNGVSPMMAMPVIGQWGDSSSVYSMLGVLPDIRLISMKGRSAGEEIEFGADTWICFPMRRNDPNGEYAVPPSPTIINTSGRYGFAIKKLDT